MRDLISGPALTCRSSDSLQDAADLMRAHRIGILVVVDDDGKTEAVVTDRDICVTAASVGKALKDIPVEAARSAVAIECDHGDPLEDALSMMQVNNVRRLVANDDDRRPIGILSIDDLAAESLRELERGDANPVLAPRVLVRTLGEIARSVAQGRLPIPQGSEAMPRPT